MSPEGELRALRERLEAVEARLDERDRRDAEDEEAWSHTAPPRDEIPPTYAP